MTEYEFTITASGTARDADGNELDAAGQPVVSETATADPNEPRTVTTETEEP